MAKSAVRLRAARIAAGYVVIKDGAEALGIPVPSYRGYEAGKNGLTDSVLRAAVEAFGITQDYLRSGKAANASDTFADRLARIIEQAEQNEEDEDLQREMAIRLRQARVARGFRSATAAAAAMGWPTPTLTTHEAGNNPIPTDRAIGYSLAYGIRPEFVLLGTLPPEEPQHTGWKDLRATGGRIISQDASAWAWLRSEAPGLAVLRLEGERLILASRRLSLPQELNVLPSHPEMRSRAYGLIESASTGDMLLIDTIGIEGRAVHATSEGVSIGGPYPRDTAPTDPTRKRGFKDPVLLGTMLGRLKLTFDAE